MLSPGFSISPKDLWNAIATQDAPQIIDVRRREAYGESPHLLPGAVWRDAARAAKDYATGDRLRDELAALGVEVMDTASGTEVRPLD